MEILKCSGVRKVFGKGESEVRALNGIDLSVEKGEFVAIVGASGSGKSTLLHILGSVDKPTSGSVIVDGVDIGTLNATNAAIFRRRKIGLIYQFYNLIPTLTVEKNIVMPLLLDKRKPEQEHYETIVQTLGIQDKLKALPHQLSGGQQQRVAVARAIAAQPSVILADEPTGNLDSRSTADIMNILKELHRSGRTVIVITHDDDIARQADRVIRIMDGRVEADYLNEGLSDLENMKKKREDS